MNTSKPNLIEGIYKASSCYVKGRDYTQSPFRYPGGKFYALKYIIPFLNAYPHDEYREPFVGGGSVFFGKPKVNHNWLNDLECDVITTYKAFQDNARSQRIIDRVGIEIASRERHAEVRSFTPENEDDVAFRTYYLNRTSYSGIIQKPAWGYAIGASSPPENWHRFITGANRKLADVELTSLDFSEVLSSPARGRSVLMYLDPPYFLADQKRAYTKPFEMVDHLRLERMLRSLDHAFLLSYDDCPQIRDLYSWAHIYEQSWFYNTANSSGPRKIGKELFITNYKVKPLEQLDLLLDLNKIPLPVDDLVLLQT
ncbi:DNA adenine methylase [Candidatus Dojkabacteria bacterium]|nr:DNA adenine methylase [Candidatus Dojkabacteria bacterium]